MIYLPYGYYSKLHNKTEYIQCDKFYFGGSDCWSKEPCWGSVSKISLSDTSYYFRCVGHTKDFYVKIQQNWNKYYNPWLCGCSKTYHNCTFFEKQDSLKECWGQAVPALSNIQQPIYEVVELSNKLMNIECVGITEYGCSIKSFLCMGHAYHFSLKKYTPKDFYSRK